jgi:hypothetical protein
MFEREDWTLFRSLDTLGQKAGVSADKIPALVLKELVDNGLDVAGSCKFGLLVGDGFWVEDEGGGIPGDDREVASLFSINRPLTSSKILRRPSRGALGNGLRVVAGAVLATDGSLVISTRGRTLALAPDRETGQTRWDVTGRWKGSGTRIEVRLGPRLTVSQRSLEWAAMAALLADGESRYTGKSSPFWYDADSFYELLQAAGQRTIRELVAEFDGCSEPKVGRMTSDYRGRLARELGAGESRDLLVLLREQCRRVKPSRLGKVGRLDQLGPGYARIEGELTLGSVASPIRAEIPAAVEAWAKVAKEPGACALVNRTPITGEISAWKEKASMCLHGCNVYLEFDAGRQPVEVWFNVDTPYMPITTDGKEPNLEAFEDLIQEAVSKAVRAAKRAAPVQGRANTKKEAILANLPAAIAKESGNGEHRFGQRQLFYGIRPPFIEEIGEQPNWKYFCDVITDHENENDQDIPGIYRDPRGSIYHPHLRQEIQLGTLSVEQYTRPGWLFNKVLYCEKEGFFPMLRDVAWPERNDCALITSKGFSTRAARDLIDMLAKSGEPCQFFCIHDADAYGTMIYQTLQEATKARGARLVEIINLGLEPAEGRRMGLQVEEIKRGADDKTAPVADYVPDEDKVWLQENRIELNAMTTPQFLGWLDRKFEPYRGKVTPPVQVMRDRLEDELRADLKGRFTRKILKRAGIDDLVERAMHKREEAIGETDLETIVTLALEKDPRKPWLAPVKRLARRISRGESRRRV